MNKSENKIIVRKKEVFTKTEETKQDYYEQGNTSIAITDFTQALLDDIDEKLNRKEIEK